MSICLPCHIVFKIEPMAFVLNCIPTSLVVYWVFVLFCFVLFSSRVLLPRLGLNLWLSQPLGVWGLYTATPALSAPFWLLILVFHSRLSSEFSPYRVTIISFQGIRNLWGITFRLCKFAVHYQIPIPSLVSLDSWVNQSTWWWWHNDYLLTQLFCTLPTWFLPSVISKGHFFPLLCLYCISILSRYS